MRHPRRTLMTTFLASAAVIVAAVLVTGVAAAGTKPTQPPGVHLGPVHVWISDVKAVEGATATMSITSSAAMNVPLTIYWETRNGSALAPRDYTHQSGEATIPAGKTATTCKVASVSNGVHGDTLSFVVHLWSELPGLVITHDGTYTIVDDDPVPTVHIGDAPSVTEGGTLVYSVTLSNKTVEPVTVDLGLWYSAAYQGAILDTGDYVGTLPASVHFDPLATGATFAIATKDTALDDAYVSPIRAWMHLTGATNAVLPFLPAFGPPWGDFIGDYAPDDNWGLGLVFHSPSA